MVRYKNDSNLQLWSNIAFLATEMGLLTEGFLEGGGSLRPKGMRSSLVPSSLPVPTSGWQAAGDQEPRGIPHRSL